MAGLKLPDLTTGAAGGFDLADYFVSGAKLGEDPTFENPRTGDTVPTSGLESMLGPRADSTDENAGKWGSWFRDLAGQAVGYAIQRDAASRGLNAPSVPQTQGAIAGAQPVAAQAASRGEPSVSVRTIMLLAAGAALVFVAMRRG